MRSLLLSVLLARSDGSFCRQRLKHALELATRAQDNYLRAAVLALISAHYFHTAGDHALSMLQACEQIAAGLGAPAKKHVEGSSSAAQVAVGNARLGLWVGQKYLGEWARVVSSGEGGC